MFFTVRLRFSVLKRSSFFVCLVAKAGGAGFSDFEFVWVTVFALVVGQLFHGHGGTGGPCHAA